MADKKAQTIQEVTEKFVNDNFENPTIEDKMLILNAVMTGYNLCLGHQVSDEKERTAALQR